MLFIDNEGNLHHYPQGYNLALYDYLEGGDLLNFVLNKSK
jgi:hypothetical protein